MVGPARVRHCFVLNARNRFHLEGPDFSRTKEIRLSESALVEWNPNPVKALIKLSTTELKFSSTPTLPAAGVHPGRPTGSLAITVTKDDSSVAGGVASTVDSLYDP
jgi:hypothetical protein